MWDPCIAAVRTKVPHVKVLFDLFHVVAQFSRIIDKVRNSEYRKAPQATKTVFKGAKYFLPINRTNIRRLKDRQYLEEFLRLNKFINAVLILKDKLEHISTSRSQTWADKALEEWCALACAVTIRQ
jgi:transposase